jgi:hypothetical protein
MANKNKLKKVYVQKKLTEYVYPYQKLLPYGTDVESVVKGMELTWTRPNWESIAKEHKIVHWSVIYKDDLVEHKGKQLTPKRFIEICKKKDIGLLAVFEDDRKYVFAWVDPSERK